MHTLKTTLVLLTSILLACGGLGEKKGDEDFLPNSKTASKAKTAPPAPDKTPVLNAAMKRVWAGEAVQASHLEGVDCEGLWALRNGAFARHGYSFSSRLAKEWFANHPKYVRNPTVTAKTVSSHLHSNDSVNIDLIKATETALGCESLPVFASAFRRAAKAGDTTWVVAHTRFPLAKTTHYLNTANGQTFSIGSTRDDQVTHTDWSVVRNCGSELTGDLVPNTPRWMCDLFSRGGGLSIYDLPADATNGALQTKGYDPKKPIKGTRLLVEREGTSWVIVQMETTYYAP